MENWKTMLDEGAERKRRVVGRRWANTLTEDEMAENFDAGYGGTEGCLTRLDEAHGVFPSATTARRWVGSVSRNADGKPNQPPGRWLIPTL